jgi:hypothetical protein
MAAETALKVVLVGNIGQLSGVLHSNLMVSACQQDAWRRRIIRLPQLRPPGGFVGRNLCKSNDLYWDGL